MTSDELLTLWTKHIPHVPPPSHRQLTAWASLSSGALRNAIRRAGRKYDSVLEAEGRELTQGQVVMYVSNIIRTVEDGDRYFGTYATQNAKTYGSAQKGESR